MELGSPPAFPLPLGDGWSKRPANARGRVGTRIVVRGREQQCHGDCPWFVIADRRLPNDPNERITSMPKTALFDPATGLAEQPP